MATVTIHDAKTNLSRLIACVERGDEIVIARGKQAVVPLDAIKQRLPRMLEPALWE
jgi:antitoxin (DNA-binding transcriptional repressor) of toxin-antitoxin stability system